ncbi:MAG: hypothetical protein EBT13_14930, partial [Rhodobacteraceae bacterium]|nr:hypothetical protein [Paracoccaceae bacterium]
MIRFALGRVTEDVEIRPTQFAHLCQNGKEMSNPRAKLDLSWLAGIVIATRQYWRRQMKVNFERAFKSSVELLSEAWVGMQPCDFILVLDCKKFVEIGCD